MAYFNKRVVIRVMYIYIYIYIDYIALAIVPLVVWLIYCVPLQASAYEEHPQLLLGQRARRARAPGDAVRALQGSRVPHSGRRRRHL